MRFDLTRQEAWLPAQRLVFSSPGTAAGQHEARRLARWWDEYLAGCVGVDISADLELPFAVRMDYLQLGAVGFGRSSGTVTRWERRREHLARDADDHFTLAVNRGASASQRETRSGHTLIAPGGASLFDHTEVSAHTSQGTNQVFGVLLPRRLLCAALPNAEDAVGAIIPAENEALRLLCYFADGLLDDDGLSDPALFSRAGQWLLDLTVLAFGTDRDNAEVARMRGLRAARLAAVLRRIRADYADPDISPVAVAARVGISTRHLHTLLQETGSSFSERVHELRLARAFALLTGQGGALPRVSDAAYAAGFTNLSCPISIAASDGSSGSRPPWPAAATALISSRQNHPRRRSAAAQRQRGAEMAGG
jgi:AraC-like DNA-binding protein